MGRGYQPLPGPSAQDTLASATTSTAATILTTNVRALISRSPFFAFTNLDVSRAKRFTCASAWWCHGSGWKMMGPQVDWHLLKSLTFPPEVGSGVMQDQHDCEWGVNGSGGGKGLCAVMRNLNLDRTGSVHLSSPAPVSVPPGYHKIWRAGQGKRTTAPS
jgi:hypothetical protein